VPEGRIAFTLTSQIFSFFLLEDKPKASSDRYIQKKKNKKKKESRGKAKFLFHNLKADFSSGEWKCPVCITEQVLSQYWPNIKYIKELPELLKKKYVLFD